jgi:hypothetical protein
LQKVGTDSKVLVSRGILIDVHADAATFESQINDAALGEKVTRVTDSKDALIAEAMQNRFEAEVFRGTDEEYLAALGFANISNIADGQGARLNNLARRHSFEKTAERVATEYTDNDGLMRPSKRFRRPFDKAGKAGHEASLNLVLVHHLPRGEGSHQEAGSKTDFEARCHLNRGLETPRHPAEYGAGHFRRHE